MKEKRIYFLDNLKSVIILTVIFFHASLTYKIDAPVWWYVLDTKRVLMADIFHVWADVFIMTIMFFISDYFALRSLERHSPGSFWKGKWLRIGLPWIVGTLLLAPHVSYIMVASRGMEIPSYIEFYRTMFLGICYQQSQYWYLGALMALYLILAVICRVQPRFLQAAAGSSPSKGLLWLLWLLGAAGIWLINQVYTDDTWTYYLAYILQRQPTRVPMYVIYFFLGAYAYRQRWFTEAGYIPSCRRWVPAFLVLSAVYVWMKIGLAAQLEPAAFTAVNALLHSLFCLVAVFTLLSVFQRFFSGTGRHWAELAMLSYPIYFAHQNIVQEMAWLVRPLETNAFVKYFIVCGASLVLCYLVSRYFLIYLAPFRTGQRKK